MTQGHCCDNCEKFICYVTAELCSKCYEKLKKYEEEDKSK